ncbi:translation initiation factor IF-2 subunit alpha [Natronobacterium gregoryi]|uniref:Translation initiation factor 2 subunit alpha n=2 Tax=Natronobacterium gregoryi TaxID=44930 RepID=L0ADP9_NATGS|nr:translation initiation factor IF-2 subunit alpha [Natronobacterium gregoryi]AFZ72033.1 translation initiation factor 2, alpha subunit (eIF-2alpha) [Natronobacterium gregoryi SP2]ELY62692.1 translation initiation factor IF-2 subunit alpha [Natronobacterium gregoryi SP2]PLK20882.1 translation initiation factor IF-2 subunit alpha [Natronobacterium gregoryi SP2]SFJ20348.1 translation initiation factor 2 subunit alpha (aeIF-2a) [Natronobacterium gregoryi]
MKYSGWPDPGTLVVGKIDEIEDFGVFVDLEEYEDKRGLIHISEVASGWIKNVRDHVREGQIVVCKVLDVDEESQQIDLSLKDVNDHQRSEKIQQWKNEQKADNWMELALGDDVDDETYTVVANELIAAHGGLYQGFKQAAIHGDEALEDADLESDVCDSIVETARENVSVPYVNVTGYVDLENPSPSGVDGIREALTAAGGNGDVPAEVDLEVSYVGAPEYRIKVQAPNYKTAESQLEESADRAIAAIENEGGEGEYHRERRTDEE